MLVGLENKKTLVIGGARGIGAEIVRNCALSGSDVAWSYRQGSAESDILLKELNSYGRNGFAVQADSTSESDTVKLFDTVRERWGKLDCLVYNTGFTSPVDFCDISFDDWKNVVDINLNGAFLAIRNSIELMREAGGGSIVIIGSAAIVAGGGGRADYAAAKAGLEGLNRAVTKRFAPENIRCNIVHPSLIETDLLKQRHPSEEKRKILAQEVPLKRLGQPEDIANAVIFFLSDCASYITGQSIFVDGGRTFCK